MSGISKRYHYIFIDSVKYFNRGSFLTSLNGIHLKCKARRAEC